MPETPTTKPTSLKGPSDADDSKMALKLTLPPIVATTAVVFIAVITISELRMAVETSEATSAQCAERASSEPVLEPLPEVKIDDALAQLETAPNRAAVVALMNSRAHDDRLRDALNNPYFPNHLRTTLLKWLATRDPVAALEAARKISGEERASGILRSIAYEIIGRSGAPADLEALQSRAGESAQEKAEREKALASLKRSHRE